MRRLFSLVFLLALLACDANLSTRTPGSSGGGGWTEWRSQHFVVKTDLPAARVSELVTEFERIYTSIEDIAFPYSVKPTGMTHVVVFRDREEYERFAPKGSGGVFRFMLPDPRVRSMILVYGDSSAASRLVFQHELVHRFVRFYFPGVPRWVNEGLAQYYSTMAIEEGKVYLGRDLPDVRVRPGEVWAVQRDPKWGTIVSVPTGSIPSAQRLLDSGPADFGLRTQERGLIEEDSRRVMSFYAGAWALIHVIKNGGGAHAAMLDAFLVDLSAGTDPEVAWRGAFASVSAGALDRLLAVFYVRRETTVLRADYRPSHGPSPFERRTLPPAEVRLLWAALRPWGGPGSESVESALDAALALAPGSADVQVWRARWYTHQGRFDLAERALRGARDARPDDEMMLYELFNLRVAQAEREPSPERAEQIARVLPELLPRASTASSLNGLAWHLAHAGRVDEALSLARRAVEADFSCFACYDTLAFALHAKGRSEEAFRTQSIALGLLPDGASAPDMSARLEQYRAAAASPAAAKVPDPAPQPRVVEVAKCPEAATEGVVAADAVQRVVRGRTDSLRICRASNPQATGRLVVDLILDAAGAVCRVEVLPSTLSDAKVADCVVKVAASLQFPPPVGGGTARVQVPFSFSSK